MSDNDPQDIGVGNSTNHSSRSVRDIQLNAQFNPYANKNVLEGYQNRTAHDIAQNKQFCPNSAAATSYWSKEAFQPAKVSDDPYNVYSSALKLNNQC